ncbi:MAG: carboxypeptidase regulatory-like domain-containing protein [Gemmatimonadota bacterium]
MTQRLKQQTGEWPGRAGPCVMALLLLAFPAVLPGPLGAQSERGTAALLGTVRAAEDNKALAGATIRVLGLDVQEISSNRGTFKIQQLPPGVHFISAEYLGFKSDTAQVLLSTAATTYVNLTLETDPVPLPSLQVDVQRVLHSPHLAGFYERKDRGLGKFITAEDLAHRSLTMNLRMIPGVRVDQCVQTRDRIVVVPVEAPASGGRSVAAQRFLLEGARGMRLGNCYDLSIGRGYGFDANARCPPEIWIDGHPINSSFSDPLGENPFNRLRAMPRDLIEGVEVYRSPGMAPAMYNRFGGCGVMLVWTRAR